MQLKLVSAQRRGDIGHNKGSQRSYRCDAYCVHTKVRVFVSPKDITVLDWLTERHYQPYKLLRPLVKEALERVGISGDIGFRWSPRAGCSCPCSPGFIVNTIGDNVDLTYDVINGE